MRSTHLYNATELIAFFVLQSICRITTDRHTYFFGKSRSIRCNRKISKKLVVTWDLEKALCYWNSLPPSAITVSWKNLCNSLWTSSASHNFGQGIAFIRYCTNKSFALDFHTCEQCTLCLSNSGEYFSILNKPPAWYAFVKFWKIALGRVCEIVCCWGERSLFLCVFRCPNFV